MSKRDEFQAKMAQRIELASVKTRLFLEGASKEKMSVERRQMLEDCRLSIAMAASKLGDLTAAAEEKWDVVRREMKDVWRGMELAVRRVTGEPVATLVRPLLDAGVNLKNP